MKSMKWILVFLLFFVAVNLNAQDVRCILLFKDGTSIDGFGDIKRNKIRFRIDLEEKADTWDHTLVKGVIIAEIEFEYVSLKTKSKKPKLLKVMRDGEVRLYANISSKPTVKNVVNVGANNPFPRVYSSGEREIAYYLKRETEKKASRFYANNEKIILKYFQNCDVISDILESKEYKRLTPLQIYDLYDVYCNE